jgi:hypothetical protein
LKHKVQLHFVAPFRDMALSAFLRNIQVFGDIRQQTASKLL